MKELNERFRTFTESHPYRLAEEFKLRPGQDVGDYTFKVRDAHVPNREWGVLIGEVVHNLRSALEHTIYAAAEKPSRDTQFPIFTKREDWEKKSCGMVYSVPEKALQIIKDAQPYREPDPAAHVIAILNRLSNKDKHRLLHTTVLTLGEAQPRFVGVRDIAELHEVEVILGPLENDRTLARLLLKPDGPDPKIQMEGQFSFGVAFAEKGDPIFGEHVIGVLREILSAVTWIVGAVEAARHSASRPPKAVADASGLSQPESLPPLKG